LICLGRAKSRVISRRGRRLGPQSRPEPKEIERNLLREIQEIEVFERRFKTKGIDRKHAGFEANVEVRASKDLGQALGASAKVEDVGQRVVLLQILDQEVEQERLSPLPVSACFFFHLRDSEKKQTGTGEGTERSRRRVAGREGGAMSDKRDWFLFGAKSARQSTSPVHAW